MLPDIDFSLEKCLKCNACTANCPMTGVTLDFGGPKHMGPEIKRLTQNQPFFDDSRIELCTLCGTCDVSCPEGVQVSVLTAHAKALHAETSGTKLRDLVLSNAELVGKLASTFGPVTNATMKSKSIRKVMETVLKIPAERRFPDYRFNNFKRRYKKREVNTERKVAYFVGCYATYNAPEVADSFVKVMEYNGIEVAYPEQVCCGVPMFSNGQMKQAIKNANKNVATFLDYARRGYDIVLTCTSCTDAFKKDYISFLQSQDAIELAEHVYDADEYLRILHENGELNTEFGEINIRAGYYSPCHMKSQGIGNPAMDILEMIPGYEISDLAASCCGQCGTFGFKEEKFEYSMALGKSMGEAVSELDADYTVTECGMCKNQLDEVTNKVTKHPMQILLEAYEKGENEKDANGSF
ncbi:anaerobic glycerol-3-phosphate dehydrogenase subunit C [Bacillaceae bacterium S4-13-56]